MEYTKLGKTDIEISRICMGCMGFGAPSAGQHTWTLDEAETREIIRYGLEQGITFYDTAIVYSGGTSEQFVGRALRDFAKREDVVVATKFIGRMPDEIKAGVTGREHLERSLDRSLANLGMDYVDLYIYHMWDWNTPVEAYMEGLDAAVRAGKVRAIGISNAYAWQIAEANEIARSRGWTEFVSIQSHYNLIMREDERETNFFAKERGLALTPYSALAAGRLSRLPGETTKRLAEDTYAMGKYDKTKEADEVIIRRVAEIAEKRGVSMTEVSIAWLLTKVAAPICGMTKVRHVDGAVRAVDLKLTGEEISYLEEAYVPHFLSGVMHENRPEAKDEEHVWVKNAKVQK